MNITERRESQTLGQLLPYLQFDEVNRLLWLKDGSATKTLSVTPKNLLSATEEDLQSLRLGLVGVLNQLPEGAFLQVALIREQSSEPTDEAIQRWKKEHWVEEGGSDNQARIDLYHAKIDQLRDLWREKHLFQTRIFITLRMTPAMKVGGGGKIGPLSFLAFGRGKSKSEKPSSLLAKEINEAFSTLKVALETQGFEVKEPGSLEQTQVIFRFLNPERAIIGRPEGFKSKPGHDLSDTVAMTDLIESRRGLSIGRTRVRVGSLKTLPEDSIPGLMTSFATETQPFVLVLTLLVLSQIKERERLSRKQRLASAMASGNSVRNLVAETQLQAIEETLQSMIARGEKLFASSFHLVTFEENEGEAHRFQALMDSAERIGNGSRWFEETVGAYPVFFGILPFAPTFITRPKPLLSSQMTDFFPIYGIGPGHEKASIIFETPYQSILAYDYWEKSPSGNGMIFGSTGSGKSMLANGLILGELAGNKPAVPANFVIDVGNSFKRTILYLGGTSLDLSPEKGTRLNPFDLEHGQTSPDPDKVKFLTAMFDEMLGDAGNLSKLERALLETEIIEFYETDQLKTLSHFKNHLAKSDSPELKRLSKLLALWCLPRPYGLLFDGETNVDMKAPFVHFELRGCQRYPDLLRVAMLVTMNAIWGEIRARSPLPSRVWIDEAHTMIRAPSDGRMNSSARQIEDFSRQIRKFGGVSIPLSQNAADLKNDEIGDGIISCSPNRFSTRQRGDEKTLREDLKMNERELQEVFSLSQVRGSFSEFYLQSESIKGRFVYRPTSLELWLSTTHPPDTALLDEVAKSHPEWRLRELMSHMAQTYPEGAEGPKVDPNDRSAA